MQKVKFYTLGCKVNQYETQVIREQFLNSGFQEIDNHLPADVYLINTCTVTQKADADSLHYIRRAKKENPQAKIIVTGCLAALDKDKIKKADTMSLIVKNKDKEKILTHYYRTIEQKNKRTNPGISYFKGHTRAFLKIQDGCSNFCAYCKVPLVRGESRSKPLKVIVQEAENLVRNGFREIVLCGICLGAFGKDLKPPRSLIDAIAALEKIEGLLRIRLSSIEAAEVTEELIQKIATSSKLCAHLHIPIQSGDDEILKKMQRRYTRDAYLGLIKRIKNQIPQIAITTDVLVGFLGETETNFEQTLDLVKKIMPLKVHIFPYSRREGTLAAQNFSAELNPAIIKERILRLRTIAAACTQHYKKQFLNKTRDVLIEGRAKNNPGFWEGYTDNYLKVLVKSKQDLKNHLVEVKLNQIVKDALGADYNCKKNVKSARN